MFRTWLGWMPWIVGTALVVGCCEPVRHDADLLINDLSTHPIDVAPMTDVDHSAPTSAEKLPAPQTAVAPEPKMEKRLQIPSALPGAKAPPIALPRDAADRAKALDSLFPKLPELGDEFEPGPSPNGQTLSLADLQQLALTNSPLIRQAAADVESTKGAVRQARAYPNPTMGFEGDTMGTNHTAGYVGAFIEQVVKTGGKLQLAEAAALMDLRNSEVALHKAKSDLASQVRAAYFGVLVARENVRISRALVYLTDEVFQIQVELVKAAQSAAYEPMQLRVQAVQARASLVQARNTYVTQWKQLASALGLPAMPPTDLAGRVDMPIPLFLHDQVLAKVLSTHTDVLTAENSILKGRYNLRLAEVTPVPDVTVHVAALKDYTVSATQAGTITPTVTVGIPVPIWDRNRGGIQQAQGMLLRANEESHRVRDDLTSRVADAFGRYQSAKVLVEYYRTQILPDQVRAYRGVYERHQQEPDKVAFGDIVQAQQTLATTITGYVTSLGSLWTAVTDVGNLLQTSDLFQTGAEPCPSECGATVPDLEHLLGLPCCHPNSEMPDPALKGADPSWPASEPGKATPSEGKQGEPGA